jgi:hypothetical protein
LVAVFVSASGIAQTPPATTASPPSKVGDRNEKVCQKIEVTGSRLATRRVCKTRAEWADMEMQNRQEIERLQVQRGFKAE